MAAKNVLMLPGMMCDARLWHAQLNAIDLPVEHADTTADDNFEEMASRILKTAPASFAVAGLSMGGILAFEIWRQAPGRVTHMALLDTSPYAETPERKTLRVKQIEDALSGQLRKLATEQLKPLYLAKSHREDESILNTILEMAMDLGPEVFRRQSLALRDRRDSTATLTTINCPTLIMCGVEDALCPVPYHETMAEKIPNAQLEVIDNCGHLSTLEQPDIVSNALVKFLQQR